MNHHKSLKTIRPDGYGPPRSYGTFHFLHLKEVAASDASDFELDLLFT